MSMTLALQYKHLSGAIHYVPLPWETPTPMTYELLGIDVFKNGFDVPVTDSYETIRDRYLAWLKTLKGFKGGCYRDQRAFLKKQHKVWTDAGFTPEWHAH